MREWRRTLDSWSKETPAVADPASLPDWVGEEARRRRQALGPKGRLRVRLVVSLALVAPIALLLWLFSLPLGDPRALTLAFGAVASVSLFIAWGRRPTERALARHRDGEIAHLEAMGESTLGGEFVGVSYADRAWTYPGFGQTVDEGILRLDLDRLVSVGRHARFELSSHAMVSTEIRRQDPGTGERGSLYLSWADGGESGTFSVALPYRRSVRRRVAEIEDLRDRIERWRGERYPHRAAPSMRPPVFSPTERPKLELRIGLPAKLLAALATFLLLAAIEAAATLVAIRMGWRRSGNLLSVLCWTSPMPWIFLASKVEARLPQRWRHKPAETVVGVPKLDGSRVSIEAERLSVGRKSGS